MGEDICCVQSKLKELQVVRSMKHFLGAAATVKLEDARLTKWLCDRQQKRCSPFIACRNFYMEHAPQDVSLRSVFENWYCPKQYDSCCV